MSKKINNTDFFKWVSSTSRDSSPDSTLPPTSILKATSSDYISSLFIEETFNDIGSVFSFKCKEIAEIAKKISVDGNLAFNKKSSIYNFYEWLDDKLWLKIKNEFPELKDRDRNLFEKLHTKNEIETYFKDKESDNNIKTKKIKKERLKRKDLFNILNNIKNSYCTNCQVFKDRNIPLNNILLTDINQQNEDFYIDETKYVFVVDAPYENDALFKFDKDSIILNLYTILSSLKLTPKDFIILFSTGCFNRLKNTTSPILQLLSCYPILETSIKYFDKSTKIFLLGDGPSKRFGMEKNDYNIPFRYDNSVLINLPNPMKDVNKFKECFEEIKDKKIRIKKENILNKNKIKNDLSKQISISETIPTQQTQPTIPNNPISNNNKKYKYNPDKEYSLDEVISDLNNDSWTVTSCTQFTYKHPVIMTFRKGFEKRIYNVNTDIDVYYSMDTSDPTIGANKTFLYTKKIPFNKLSLERKNNNVEWYNADFPTSTYFLTQLKKKYNFEKIEGDEQPRVWYLDIETGTKEAIKIKHDSKKCIDEVRLFTIFDSYLKKFICLVFDQKNTKAQEITHTNFNGYDVDIKRFDNEINLFYEIFKLFDELDPDLISGWNVEKFDMTFLIKRAETLGIEFKGKYDKFFFKEIFGKIKSVAPMSIGHFILDYASLYRMVQLSKKESYRLDYIAKEELGPDYGKLPIKYDHDTMYFEHLNDYVEYNLYDVLRVYQLENKLQYIKHKNEICHICNISWTDIYSQMKTIDGLLYNFYYDSEICFKMKKHDNTESVDKEEYKGGAVLDPQIGIHEHSGDLDASSMYPTAMIMYNLFKDTLVAKIPEDIAEAFIYYKDSLKDKTFILKEYASNKEYQIKYSDLENYLQDKILILSGAIYWRPEKKKSLVSTILIYLLETRARYRKLLADAMENNEKNLVERYEVLQYAYKQLANSIYGVMGTNMYRLSDFTTANSITAVGREFTSVISHQASKFVEETVNAKDINIDHNLVPIEISSVDEARKIENRPYILYGDSVVGSSNLHIKENSSIIKITIEELFNKYSEKYKIEKSLNGKEYIYLTDEKLKTLTLNDNGKLEFKDLKYIMRHKTNKQLYRIRTDSKTFVDVTEDHSLISYRPNSSEFDSSNLHCKSPKELTNVDFMLTIEDEYYSSDCFVSKFFINKLSPTEEYVYDIEVDETHRFFANNILVHNTDSIFIDVGRALREINDNKEISEDDMTQMAWDLISKTGEYVNEYVIPDILKRRYISFEKGTKYVMNFKEEFILRRILFLDIKKQYAYHAIMKKGKKVDVIEIKGLEAVRSDYARFSREILLDLLNRLLYNYDVKNKIKANSEIKIWISEKEKELDKLIDEQSIEIARPSTLSKSFEEYSTLTDVVRGMVIYSELTGYEYSRMSKGYKFPLIRLDWAKIGITQDAFMKRLEKKYSSYKWWKPESFRFDCIIIPVDKEYLDIPVILDKDQIKKFVLYDRIKKILKGIGITAITEKEVIKAKKKSSAIMW